MKKLRMFLVAILSVAMVLSAGCFAPPGGLTLTELVLDSTSVDTEYVLGDTYDFSGIQLVAKYSDSAENKQLGYDDVVLTFDNEFNTKLGSHTITVKYTDTEINQSKETTFTVSVVSSTLGDDPVTTKNVLDFLKPASYTNYLSRATADRIAYGQAGYEAQLAKKNLEYKVGDDNAFKFVTKLWVLDAELLDAVEEVGFPIEAQIYQDDILLVAGEVGADNKVEYTRPGESTVLVTVDIVRQEYLFASEMVGQKFTIKVSPSSTHYVMSTPIVQEVTFTLVDGLNIYDPIQLAVINNYGTHWDSLKQANGLLDVNPSAIIIQNDMVVKAEHMPEELLGTLQEDYYYYEAVTVEGSTTYQRQTTPLPAGTKFIKDKVNIYDRQIIQGETFTIEGNSYSLDFSKAPLVPSSELAPLIRDVNGNVFSDYGDDFSNTSYMIFHPLETNGVVIEEGGDVYINNLDILGNAERSQIVDKEGGDLRSGGGSIFVKSWINAVNLDNVCMRNFFIGAMSEYQYGNVNFDYVKGFDFFQNALFAFGGKFNISNCDLERAGGPLTILQHKDPDTNTTIIPQVTFVNSILKSELTGQEFWFATLGANQVAGQIALLSGVLAANQMGAYASATGKMNIICLLMASGSDMSVATKFSTQGKIVIADSEDDDTPFVLSRMYSDATDVIAQTTYAIQSLLLQQSPSEIVPLFSVSEMFVFLHDPNPTAPGLTMVASSELLIPFNPASELDAQQSMYVGALKDRFVNSDYYALNYGGFGIVLGSAN